MNVDMKLCTGELTLDKMYETHDGKFLCILTTGNYVVGDLEWEQGYSPNYYVSGDNCKYYHYDIKSIGALPNET